MHHDPLKTLAALNPLPARDIRTAASVEEYDRTYQEVLARRGQAEVRGSSLPRKAAIAALATLAALSIPALALSGQLGDLFDFSNQGERVEESDVGLRAASSLEITGVEGGVKHLATRDGVGIYVGRGRGGTRCFFVGPPNGRLTRGLSGGCLNEAASASFPSPEQPIVNMTSYRRRVGVPGEMVTRLAGVAADGVTAVQVLGMFCQVIVEAPVIANVFVEADIPAVPAAGIVAIDGSGETVHTQKMLDWDESACATTRPG